MTCSINGIKIQSSTIFFCHWQLQSSFRICGEYQQIKRLCVVVVVLVGNNKHHCVSMAAPPASSRRNPWCCCTSPCTQEVHTELLDSIASISTWTGTMMRWTRLRFPQLPTPDWLFHCSLEEIQLSLSAHGCTHNDEVDTPTMSTTS